MYCCDKDVERNIYVLLVNDSVLVIFIVSVIIYCIFKNLFFLLFLLFFLFMLDNNVDLFCNVQFINYYLINLMNINCIVVEKYVN